MLNDVFFISRTVFYLNQKGQPRDHTKLFGDIAFLIAESSWQYPFPSFKPQGIHSAFFNPSILFGFIVSSPHWWVEVPSKSDLGECGFVDLYRFFSVPHFSKRLQVFVLQNPIKTLCNLLYSIIICKAAISQSFYSVDINDSYKIHFFIFNKVISFFATVMLLYFWILISFFKVFYCKIESFFISIFKINREIYYFIDNSSVNNKRKEDN